MFILFNTDKKQINVDKKQINTDKKTNQYR